MKTSKTISLAILIFAFAISHTQAQTDYKGHRIDAAGKIIDKDGKHVGTVTKEGAINDASGKKVAHVDGSGSVIDVTGKNLGKVGKNGTFTPYSSTSNEWTISNPENGVCLVKDKDGKVIAEVHETYKHIGACAVHCLINNMNHNEMLDKSVAAYACPMHPEIASDKAGKCSKCGMALVKK